MAHGPKQPQTLRDCKLKRVYPRLPLRVHSAVPKGLAGSGSGYPFPPEPTAGGAVCGFEWDADRVRIRLENALRSEARMRLESAARRRGSNVEDFIFPAREEAS
jgi:hypothetical protein